MLEYKGIAAEYRYDYIDACRQAEKLKDVHTYIMRKLAAERNWEYREDPKPEEEEVFFRKKPYGYLTSAHWAEEFRLENNEFVKVFLYVPKERPGIRYDGIVFHWNADRSYCHVFVCPVYSPPDDPSGYSEGSGVSMRLVDGVIYASVYDRYADSADIHDHDHYTVEAGFVYDVGKKELKYYIPE